MDLHLLKEDADSYEVGHKESGKKMKIPKKGLSPKAHDLIKSMKPQHFDEGGPVVDMDQVLSNAAPQQAPQSGGATGSWEAPPPAPVAVAPQQAAVPLDPLVQNKVSTEGLLNQEEQAYKDYQKSAAGEGAQMAAAYKPFLDQSAQKTPDMIFAEGKAKDDALRAAYESKQVDPDRFVKNQSTGSKIAGFIGAILGGISQGTNGGENPALASLNKAINNDIEAQKNEQGKALNLYHMNREATGDQIKAHLETQNQLWTGVQAKLGLAQAGMLSPTAKLNAQKAISDIEQKKIANRLQLGLLGQTQPGAQGGASQANPLQLVSQLVPPEHQKQAITELGQAQAAVQNESKIKELFYQAAKDTRPVTGGANALKNMLPGYTPPSIKALNLLYDPLIHDNEGRINELEQQHVQANSPQGLDSDETVDKKWDAIKTFLEHKKSAPTAMAYNINPENFASTTSNPAARLSPQEQTYLNWAKANPKNPKAQLVIQKLGVK